MGLFLCLHFLHAGPNEDEARLLEIANLITRSENTQYDPKAGAVYSANKERVQNIYRLTIELLNIPEGAKELALQRINEANPIPTNPNDILKSGLDSNVGTILSVISGEAGAATLEYYQKHPPGDVEYTKFLQRQLEVTDPKWMLFDPRIVAASLGHLSTQGDATNDAHRRLSDKTAKSIESLTYIFSNAKNYVSTFNGEEQEGFRRSLVENVNPVLISSYTNPQQIEHVPLLQKSLVNMASTREFWNDMDPTKRDLRNALPAKQNANPWSETFRQFPQILKAATSRENSSGSPLHFLFLTDLPDKIISAAKESTHEQYDVHKWEHLPEAEVVNVLTSLVDAAKQAVKFDELPKSYGSSIESRRFRDSIDLLRYYSQKAKDPQVADRALVALVESFGAVGSNQRHQWEEIWVKEVLPQVESRLTDIVHPPSHELIAAIERAHERRTTSATDADFQKKFKDALTLKKIAAAKKLLSRNAAYAAGNYFPALGVFGHGISFCLRKLMGK